MRHSGATLGATVALPSCAAFARKTLKVETSSLQNQIALSPQRGANFASRYSVVHAMRILPRNLHALVLALDLRFYVPFVAVFWPLLFGGAVSAVKNKVF